VLPGAARFTFSSSHPAALTSYLRAGLLPRWPLCYLAGPPLPSLGTDAAVGPVTAAEAGALDEQVTGGGDRTADYVYWTTHLDAEAFVVMRADAPAAVGARTIGRVIHLVCRDDADPGAAVRAALTTKHRVGQVQICLPGPHPAVQLLAEHGYRIVEHDVAMATASVVLPTTHAYSPALA
jgi:hypothetical protein